MVQLFQRIAPNATSGNVACLLPHKYLASSISEYGGASLKVPTQTLHILAKWHYLVTHVLWEGVRNSGLSGCCIVWGTDNHLWSGRLSTSRSNRRLRDTSSMIKSNVTVYCCVIRNKNTSTLTSYRLSLRALRVLHVCRYLGMLCVVYTVQVLVHFYD